MKAAVEPDNLPEIERRKFGKALEEYGFALGDLGALLVIGPCEVERAIEMAAKGLARAQLASESLPSALSESMRNTALEVAIETVCSMAERRDWSWCDLAEEADDHMFTQRHAVAS